MANENIRQFAKPKEQSTQHKCVCGEQKHLPVRQTLSVTRTLARMRQTKTFAYWHVCKLILVKAYQYF